MIALAHYQICQLSNCVIALSHLQAVCQQHCSEEALPWVLLWGLQDHQHLGQTAFRFTIKVFRNPSLHCICNQLSVISVFFIQTVMQEARMVVARILHLCDPVGQPTSQTGHLRVGQVRQVMRGQTS